MNNNGANEKDDVAHRIWRNQGKNCRNKKLNKSIYFKHHDKEKSNQILSEKKLAILREPILKSIGRSVYHNGNQNKLCCEPKSTVERILPKNEPIDATNRIWFGKTNHQCVNEHNTNASASAKQHGIRNVNDVNDGNNCSTSMSINKNECRPATTVTDPNNVMIHRIENWQLNSSTVDFKSLVNECSNLTLAGHDTANNSTAELHKTRNFQTLQANQIATVTSPPPTSETASTSDANNTHSPNNSIHTALSAAVNSVMSCSLSSNSSNSSSCSQQARMNSSNCDVTIDELASYIEFQLHLPKPMSSNVYEAMFS